MLTDPITLRGLNLSSHTAITALGSTSLARVQEQGGTSVYGPTNDGNGISTTVRVSHSISNENKPNKTSRVLARVDLKGFARDGSLFTAFAYVVVGMPEDGNLYGNAVTLRRGIPLLKRIMSSVNSLV